VHQITDEDVLQSYEDSIKPGGCMHEYLRHAQLGVLLGQSLFVHGQIVGNHFKPGTVRGADQNSVAWCVGVVPDEERPTADVRQWLKRLNAWARREIEEWERAPTWTQPPMSSSYEGWKGRAGSELICYGTPASRVPTVVYCRFLTDQCMPLQYPPDLVAHLIRNGVKNVVVGHTPHGNAPTVIQSNGVAIIMGDTSYSHMQSNLYYPGDNRGKAVSDIIFNKSECSIRGYTEKCEYFEYEVGLEGGADPYVGWLQSGEHLEKKYFVKAKLPSNPLSDLSGNHYLMSHIDGFSYEYAIVHQNQVQRVLAGQPVDVAVAAVQGMVAERHKVQDCHDKFTKHMIKRLGSLRRWRNSMRQIRKCGRVP